MYPSANYDNHYHIPKVYVIKYSCFDYDSYRTTDKLLHVDSVLTTAKAAITSFVTKNNLDKLVKLWT